jgi:hypothetical protein
MRLFSSISLLLAATALVQAKTDDLTPIDLEALDAPLTLPEVDASLNEFLAALKADPTIARRGLPTGCELAVSMIFGYVDLAGS